ncbi:low temperature requirement protein A [Microbacterium sp. DT81.1]|uniref:low temperature requirement protein A n=1 Tax=Microbacterium sp. DT81.1 TaxID=3393413 RepID=UPI003CE79771
MDDAQAPGRSGRRVHWLELFFDLVMVAYIGQIAHTMHGDPGWVQAGAFFGLLAAAWWAWVNASLTMNLFGARVTPSIWVSVTIAMVAIGVMAAAVPEAFGDRAAAFAIGNAVIRIVWFAPWFAKREKVGVPLWRPVLYSIVTAGLWVASIFVPPPSQFLLWVMAVAIEVALLSALGSQAEWLRASLDIDHLVERISLLVVIVFGESILSIIAEFDAHWAPLPAVTAVLGLLAVSVLAWIFFGYGAVAAERGLRGLQLRGSIGGLRDTVMYLPFLLIAGITMFAAALGTAVAEAGHHLPAGAAVCLAAGVSLFFLTCAAEALRYGAAKRDVVLWGPAGIVLPWALVPVAQWVDATAVVAASVVLLALLAGLNELNVRRMRARGALAAVG